MQIVCCTAGDVTDDANPPAVYLIDPYEGNATVLVNNFFGQRFNGFDDLLTLSDGFALAFQISMHDSHERLGNMQLKFFGTVNKAHTA